MPQFRTLSAAATLSWLAACATSSATLVEQAAVPMTAVPVAKVEADLSAPDPWAAYWNASRPASFGAVRTTNTSSSALRPRPVAMARTDSFVASTTSAQA